MGNEPPPFPAGATWLMAPVKECIGMFLGVCIMVSPGFPFVFLLSNEIVQRVSSGRGRPRAVFFIFYSRSWLKVCLRGTICFSRGHIHPTSPGWPHYSDASRRRSALRSGPRCSVQPCQIDSFTSQTMAVCEMQIKRGSRRVAAPRGKPK